jgi:DNA-binding NtrC family response regulator
MRGDGDSAGAAATVAETVLMVESDVVVRMAIAGYLRDCGYRVIEASGADEAMAVLERDDTHADVVLSAVGLAGDADGFALAQWIRRRRPGLEVLLAGTLRREAQAAGDLCQEGPQLAKPYEPETLVSEIRRLLARRPRP